MMNIKGEVVLCDAIISYSLQVAMGVHKQQEDGLKTKHWANMFAYEANNLRDKFLVFKNDQEKIKSLYDEVEKLWVKNKVLMNSKSFLKLQLMLWRSRWQTLQLSGKRNLRIPLENMSR